MGVYVGTRVNAPQRANPQRSATPSTWRMPKSTASPTNRLQRAVGNRAISRLLLSPIIQPKLTVSHPEDEYEREADRVADQVMRMPEPQSSVAPRHAPPTIQRACVECEDELQPKASMTLRRAPAQINRMCSKCQEEPQRLAGTEKMLNEPEEEEPLVQPKRESGKSPATSSDLESYLASSRGRGQPLSDSVRAHFEPRFGHDFSRVRVHTDSGADQASGQISAHAFTAGSDVYFAQGQYKPGSHYGDRLLGHELAHVVQQGHANEAANAVTRLQRASTPAEPDEGESDGPDLNDVLAGLLAGATATAPAIGAIASILPSLPPPCNPATSLLMARALHVFVSNSFIPFSRGMFGSQTSSLWQEYLNPSLGLPRPARTFGGSGEIVDGFTRHHKSAESEQEIVDASVVSLRGPAFSLIPAAGSTKVVPVTSLVPSATLRTRLNSGSDPMALIYDSPATTIPGNIAGGIGAGGPPGGVVADRDTRDVTGSIQLDVDASGANLTVTPSLTFLVHDTVDFCPGALGGAVARVETVPMSILEATEGRFGPIFAADVPFDVSYPGPGVFKTIPLPAPPPTPPSPVPPIVPPPSPTPPLPFPPDTIRIHFNFDKPRPGGSSLSDSLDSSGTVNLRILIDQLRGDPSSKVGLVGRTSPEGSPGYNMDLGKRRVRMIGQALKDAGISGSQIDSPAGLALAPGCVPLEPGLFSCGEIGATGAADREVRAQMSGGSPTPPGPTPPTPPGPTPPGPVPPTPPGPVPPTPPGPVPPTPPGPTPTGFVTLKSVRFLSDHHVMKDNRVDWENTGTLFPKPEWKAANPGSATAPISHNRATNIEVELTYDVGAGSPGTPITFIGKGTKGFLTFTGSTTLTDGTDQVSVLSSSGATPDAIAAFHNQSISWSVEFASRRQLMGTTPGLDVFVTMAPPLRSNEVTYKRMDKAVELTESIHTLDPHELVHGIMMNFGAYNLDVQYSNAWNMADNIRLGAQCIDIVRFVMGLIETVGCPGTAEAKLIWAKPTSPAKAEEDDYLGGHSLHDYPPHPAHPTWGAGLIDANACPNNFEAALRFTHGDTRYYPGGVSLIDPSGRKIIFKDAQQVLEIFQYLAWLEGTGIRKRWIAREFLISYTGRRTDVVPFTLVCDSKVLP